MVDVHNIRETMFYSLRVHIIYIYLAELQTILYISLIIFDGVIVSVLASSVVDRWFIGGVIVSVLASSVVDRWFELRSCQAKDYQIGICCSLLSLQR